MMNNTIERSAVKVVAKLTPWLAPFPSAFFVARAAMVHLHVPLAVTVVIAAVIETLGLASVHTWLWLSDWNASKRKSDPAGPANLAVILGAVYLVTTVGLTVILEVKPSLSLIAPALFPILAVVGAVNLALIAQQEQREATVGAEKSERRAARMGAQQVHKGNAQQVHTSGTASAQEGAQINALGAVNRTRQERKAALMCALLDTYRDSPDMGATEAARILGVHRNTVYGYVSELESAGRLRKDGSGWEVL